MTFFRFNYTSSPIYTLHSTPFNLHHLPTPSTTYNFTNPSLGQSLDFSSNPEDHNHSIQEIQISLPYRAGSPVRHPPSNVIPAKQRTTSNLATCPTIAIATRQTPFTATDAHVDDQQRISDRYIQSISPHLAASFTTKSCNCASCDEAHFIILQDRVVDS